MVEEAIRGPRCSSIGEGPSDVERPWPRSYDVLHGHGVRGAVRGGAIGAIDRDIEGKALGSPSASCWEER